MTHVKLTEEDNLIIQPFLIGCLLHDLKDVDFLSSNYCKDNFCGPLSDSLNEMTLDSQGLVIILFYAFLVVPYERLKNKLPSDYDDINKKIQDAIDKKIFVLDNNYPNKDYLKHIRNATAHVKFKFEEKKSLTFIDDESNRGYHFELTIPLDKIHLILYDLKVLIINYFTNNREIISND